MKLRFFSPLLETDQLVRVKVRRPRDLKELKDVMETLPVSAISTYFHSKVLRGTFKQMKLEPTLPVSYTGTSFFEQM